MVEPGACCTRHRMFTTAPLIRTNRLFDSFAAYTQLHMHRFSILPYTSTRIEA